MLKPYDEYRIDTPKWMGDIPANWDLYKISEIFAERRTKVSDKDFEALSVCKAGVVPQLESAVKTDNGDNRKLVCIDDFAINSRSDRKGSGGVSKYNGSVSLIITVLKPKIKQNSDFIHYLMRSVPFSEEFYRNGKGLVSDLWTTNYDAMKNIILPIPPITEQKQIVSYLNWKTAQMDYFVKEKEKEIIRLEELKKALINKAVTKGLNENVPMPKTGIDWMPEIPKHWEMIPAKALFKESKEKRHSDDELATASQKYGIISQKKYMEIENRRVVVTNQSTDDWKHVVPNNFVISLRSFQGGLELCNITGCVTWHYIVLIPNNKVYPNYFKYLFKSKSYIHALQRTSDFIRDGQDLRYSNFVQIPLPLVPVEEQIKIAEYIDNKLSYITEAISNIDKEIALVNELRTRTIADVVTGKVDVRNVKIPEEYKVV